MNVMRAVGVVGAVVGTGFVVQPTASAQTAGWSRLYHLVEGSTEQEGCFGACACPIALPAAMRGTFVLTRTSTDPLYTNYAMSDVRWRTRTANPFVLVGAGTYRVGGEFALVEQMTVDGSVNDGAVRHWDSGTNPVGPGAAFPVITVQMRIPDAVCFNYVLTVNAAPISGDWNADGHMSVQDIFDFLGAWMDGTGDFNEDEVVSVQDIFDFLNAWLAGM